MKRAFTTPLNLLLLLILLLMVLETSWLHLMTPLENKLMDRFVKSQAIGLRPDQDIVIVDIDQASLDRMNDIAGSWPWPRSVHGELVEGIAKQGPKAIVFDIWFSEPDKFRPESDAYFNEVLTGVKNVYLPMLRQDAEGDREGVLLADLAPAMGGKQVVSGSKALATARANLLLPKVIAPASWRLGIINFLEDSDGIGRRYRLYFPKDGWKIPSLPARLAHDLGFQVPDQESIILGWRGAAHSYPHISYADLYADFTSSRAQRLRNPIELRDKIVIIGATASGLHDIRSTPIDGLYPALEILATAIDNLKNRRAMVQAPPGLITLLGLVLLIPLFITFRQNRDALKIGMALVAVALAMLLASYALISRQYLLPVLSPLLFASLFYVGAALDEYFRERTAREHAVQMFSRFVNPHVVKELVASGGLSRGGEERQVTLLFSDIRGFTTLSESRTPQQVVALLNDYFGMQVEVIFSHAGALDKFIGDAIMAFWGAPLDDPLHAQHAISAALDMCDRLESFRMTLGEGDQGFDVGIGIHSGPAVVGLIGSEQRREYTAIGDTVNLASRIEGLTKGIARILVSEESMMQCADAFDFVDKGSYKVKGRNKEVRLFEPRRKSP